MKIRYTDAYAKRAGDEADVLPAAAERMIARGLAEEVKAEKPAKKAAAKKGEPKA